MLPGMRRGQMSARPSRGGPPPARGSAMSGKHNRPPFNRRGGMSANRPRGDFPRERMPSSFKVISQRRITPPGRIPPSRGNNTPGKITAPGKQAVKKGSTQVPEITTAAFSDDQVRYIGVRVDNTLYVYIYIYI